MPAFGPVSFDSWLATELRRLLGPLAESESSPMWQPVSRGRSEPAAERLVLPSLRLAAGAAVLASTCGGLALAYHAGASPVRSGSSLTQALSTGHGPSVPGVGGRNRAVASAQAGGYPGATPGRRGAGHLRQPTSQAAHAVRGGAGEPASGPPSGHRPGVPSRAEGGGDPAAHPASKPTPGPSGRGPKPSSQEFKP